MEDDRASTDDLPPALQRLEDEWDRDAARFDRLQDELDEERAGRERWMDLAGRLATEVNHLRRELAAAKAMTTSGVFERDSWLDAVERTCEPYYRHGVAAVLAAAVNPLTGMVATDPDSLAGRPGYVAPRRESFTDELRVLVDAAVLTPVGPHRYRLTLPGPAAQ